VQQAADVDAYAVLQSRAAGAVGGVLAARVVDHDLAKSEKGVITQGG
jgi:hypothetical protein